MTSDALSGAKILVVGGAGFVGSTLCHELLKHDPAQLIIVDNLLSADIRNVPEADNVTFMFGSITQDAILETLPRDLDFVFHLATYHGNQSSMHDPLADHENNTLTTLKLFDRLKLQTKLRKVVYASAGCTVAQKTFDKADATTEDDAVSLYLDSPYQISKIIGEFYGNYYLLRHGLPFVKARFQNVYGPREILGAGQWRGTPSTVWRNVTPSFIFRALCHQSLPLDNGGIATRDFIHVDDVARGLVACALRGEPGGVYNIASGVETSILDLANTINRLTGNPTAPAIEPARDWDRSGKRFADTSKSETELGFTAEISLEEGLEQTIRWTRANIGMIHDCMLRHARYVEIPTPIDLAGAATAA